MFGRFGKIILIAAIVVSAFVTILMLRQITLGQQKLRVSDPSFINYLLQMDHLSDKLGDGLNSLLHDQAQSGDVWRDVKKNFDVLWSLHKVSIAWKPGGDINVAGAEQLSKDVKAYLKKYDLFFQNKSIPQNDQIRETIADLKGVKDQLHPVGTSFYLSLMSTENELQEKLKRLYRYLLTATLLMFGATAILFGQLFLNGRRTQVLFEDAESSRKQLADVIEELRSGKRERKAKDSFLAAASHDLRQPLHALGLFVNALDDKVTTPDGPVILEKIRQSHDALNSLFNSLLDISKLDAGVVQISPSHFEISALFDTVTQSYAEIASQKNLEFSNSHSDQVAHTDYLLLRRIVSNLIDNALVHTEAGGVKVHCVDRNGALEISVSDTGPGIPEEEQKSIFSEYYQLKNPERDRAKGLGLGLSIVKRLSDLLDLKISLDSKIGEGSTFKVIVPKGIRSEVVFDSDSQELLAGNLDLRGLIVLIIDDEKEVREAMELLVGGINGMVYSTESAEAACELVVQGNIVPELIIADYRLREGRTGDQAIEMVRDELNQDVPAMIVTGDTSPERVRMATESGFSLLHKPVSADELVLAISALISETRADRRVS